MNEIDRLTAKARRQAIKLNRTLDRLQALGVVCSVSPSVQGLFIGSAPRVRLTLIDPVHDSADQSA